MVEALTTFAFMNEAIKKIEHRGQKMTSIIGAHGKIPPQATDIEATVLGALLLDKDPLNEVIEILKPDSFYKDQHQVIYEAISELFNQSQPIDLLTVNNQLRKNGKLELAGGAYYLSELTNRVASSANIEAHARIISQKYIQRELIRISTKIIEDAYDETKDILDLLDDAESNLFSIAEGNLRKNYESMSKLIKKAIEQIDSAKVGS